MHQSLPLKFSSALRLLLRIKSCQIPTVRRGPMQRTRRSPLEVTFSHTHRRLGTSFAYYVRLTVSSFHSFIAYSSRKPEVPTVKPRSMILHVCRSQNRHLRSSIAVLGIPRKSRVLCQHCCSSHSDVLIGRRSSLYCTHITLLCPPTPRI